MSKPIRFYNGIERAKVMDRRCRQFDGYNQGGLGYISAIQAKAIIVARIIHADRSK
jgi:hypothetical protein